MPTIDMNVEYSPEAVKDLGRVYDFIFSKNPFAARRLAIDLQEGVEKLMLFPQIGLPVFKAPDPEAIRDLYIGSYTVRYLISVEAIFILRIWHNKENEKNS